MDPHLSLCRCCITYTLILCIWCSLNRAEQTERIERIRRIERSCSYKLREAFTIVDILMGFPSSVNFNDWSFLEQCLSCYFIRTLCQDFSLYTTGMITSSYLHILDDF